MKYQQWNIAQRSQEAYKAMERQGVPTLVAATLCARGMTDLAEAKGLLSSGEDQLQDPFLMKDMDLATARIGRALRNGEKIAVYGDYDVDGITSTCLLTHYLRAQGGDVCYYIPNRLSEGYGVNREAVEELARQGVRLMITVDCGITAVEEVAYASGLGIDVIITDHHECKEEIPAAVAVVDPHRKDCPYPFKDLAGVGVALKLVMALGGEKRYRALFQEYADLAAVGTVAFALLFGVPRKFYFYCGLVGGAGWLIYAFLTQRLSATETEAVFFATLGVILLCRVFAVREECPVTVFLIAGIFPLVPGTRIYWTAYYAVTDQLALAQQNGFAALKDALAIVLGIVVIFELPNRMFHWLARRK